MLPVKIASLCKNLEHIIYFKTVGLVSVAKTVDADLDLPLLFTPELRLNCVPPDPELDSDILLDLGLNGIGTGIETVSGENSEFEGPFCLGELRS